jgi:DNA-binding PadR family transcriptional regulator
MKKLRPTKTVDELARRMGKPSELILRVLVAAHEPLPGFEISRRVARILEIADAPFARLDASTLHYALSNMEDDGLVKNTGKREVDVPAPHGKTYRELREVYAATGLGADVAMAIVSLNYRIDRAARQLAPTPGPQEPRPGEVVPEGGVM